VENPYHGLYTNRDQMMKAVRHVTQCVFKIASDSFTAHKTKQMAYVMSVFAHRIHHEGTLFVDADPEGLLREMMMAVSELARVDRIIPNDRDSSTVGSKNTLPMDLECFKYLAMAVDNLTLMAYAEGGEETVKLSKMTQEIFFTFSAYRLSGGIDSFHASDRVMSHTITTDSFVYSFTKFNGANVLADEVKHVFETNTRGDREDRPSEHINPLDLNMDQNTEFSQAALEDGHVEVIIPPASTQLKGENLLVAVMYSIGDGA
jgi:hypothetical protein